MSSLPITLQINLTPRDFRFARYLLPHQLRQLGGQVSEVLLVIESRRSKGAFGDDWDEGLQAIMELAKNVPNARVVSVDYSPQTRKKISREFYGGHTVPLKDWRGGPFYCYFFGLSAAAHDLVFHIDSDMFFGGGSQTWLAEAVEVLKTYPDILVLVPFSGPPLYRDGTATAHDPTIKERRELGNGLWTYVADDFTTRHFLIDRKKLGSQFGPLHVGYHWDPRPIHRFLKTLLGLRAIETPEDTIEAMMKEKNVSRAIYLGRAPGMWALHPPLPPFPGFLDMLPKLIERIEKEDIPEGQRGYYDMNVSMSS
jgi:hypothetical protein